MRLRFTCPNEACEKDMDGIYDPGTPPTIRMDPNSCDPGDPGELDYPDVCPYCGAPIHARYAREALRREFQREVDDALEREAEARADKLWDRYD